MNNEKNDNVVSEVVYGEFGILHSYKIFKKFSLNYLIETISNFFSCSVDVTPYPQKYFAKKYQINIHDNPRRGFYPISEDRVLILGRMYKDNQLVTAIGFDLHSIDVVKQTKILNVFEKILTRFLTRELPVYFENSSLLFGDEIIKETIADYIGKGYYDKRQLRHLIEYFFKLRTTSFEGDYFSTGAIFTKSQDILDGKRYGIIKKITKHFYISDTEKINKRIWYLVDGKTSFFIGNKNLCFNNIFILDSEYAKGNFLDTHSLALTLKGGDFLIKVENEKLLSICSSDGSEFIFFENQWRYRNYSILKDLLKSNITENDDIINSILFYVISCSKKQHGTILWFPQDLNDIDQYINPQTKNKFLEDDIYITDKQSINHIFRCITSDGATIIDKEGKLLFMGVVVNIEKADVSGIIGTGETAALVLSENGLSIKISSDGLIKIFTKGAKAPFIF